MYNIETLVFSGSANGGHNYPNPDGNPLQWPAGLRLVCCEVVVLGKTLGRSAGTYNIISVVPAQADLQEYTSSWHVLEHTSTAAARVQQLCLA